ncbi:hypothetical protein AAIG35_04370 [Cellulosimicrobium funkei]
MSDASTPNRDGSVTDQTEAFPQVVTRCDGSDGTSNVPDYTRVCVHAKSETPVETLIRHERDPHWVERFANVDTDDALMEAAFDYLRASLAHGWPSSPVRRNARRREIAALLIETARRP